MGYERVDCRDGNTSALQQPEGQEPVNGEVSVISLCHTLELAYKMVNEE
jgi:hypothetical protein